MNRNHDDRRHFTEQCLIMGSFFMDTMFDPIIAILGIFIPLGVAYSILFFHSRHLDYGHPKVSAATDDVVSREATELSCAEKKQAARLMMYWLF